MDDRALIRSGVGLRGGWLMKDNARDLGPQDIARTIERYVDDGVIVVIAGNAKDAMKLLKEFDKNN